MWALSVWLFLSVKEESGGVWALSIWLFLSLKASSFSLWLYFKA